jgi:hypothetical protein
MRDQSSAMWIFGSAHAPRLGHLPEAQARPAPPVPILRLPLPPPSSDLRSRCFVGRDHQDPADHSKWKFQVNVDHKGSDVTKPVPDREPDSQIDRLQLDREPQTVEVMALGHIRVCRAKPAATFCSCVTSFPLSWGNRALRSSARARAQAHWKV